MTKTIKETLKSWPKNRNRIRKGLFCQCPHCPTYLNAEKETEAAKKFKAIYGPFSLSSLEQEKPSENAYCLMGMSFNALEQEEICLCPTCVVQRNLGYTYIFYCMRGCEKAQRSGDEPQKSR
jgi:hypothetical protein